MAMGSSPAATGSLAYCRITSAPARKHSRPRSGSACGGNIDLYGTICISTSSASTPRLVHSHLPRGPCLTSILMRGLLLGLLVPHVPQTSQVRNAHLCYGYT